MSGKAGGLRMPAGTTCSMTAPRYYAPHLYDRNFRLRVPMPLWVVASWALLHFVLLIPQTQRSSGVWGELLGDWRLVPPYALVLLVMVSYGFRLPEASSIMRGIWHRGRALLLVGFGLGTVLFAILHWPVLQQPDNFVFAHLWAILGINILALGYVAVSRYLIDLFADYPEVTDGDRPRVAPRTLSKTESPGEAYYRQALKLAKEGRQDDALIGFREAVMLDPTHADAWNSCGVLLVQMGYPQEARQAFLAALEARPGHRAASRNLEAMKQ